MRAFRKAGLRAQKKRSSKKLSKAERLEWGKKLRDSTRRDIAATMERLIEELRVATAANDGAEIARVWRQLERRGRTMPRTARFYKPPEGEQANNAQAEADGWARFKKKGTERCQALRPHTPGISS